MSGSNFEVLVEAVSRNAAAVLSLPSAGMLRHHKSRFLSQTSEGLWIEGAREDRMLLDELIATRIPAGVSFKTSTRMISFASPVLQRQEAYQINPQTIVEAVLIAMPASVDSVQRRNCYRVRLPVGDEGDIRTRLWRIPEHHYLPDRPQAALEMPHQLLDISTGGLGVSLLGSADQPIRGSQNERLRIELGYRGEHALIEGRLRLPGNPERGSRCHAGVAFKKLESNLEGRQALALLNRIVGDLQRDEIRRNRLGLRTAG